MSDKVTVDYERWTRINAEVQDMKALLKQAKTAIDHARKWRINSDPDFNDTGIYRKISDEIAQKLSNG